MTAYRHREFREQSKPPQGGFAAAIAVDLILLAGCVVAILAILKFVGRI